jgi:hypothetical protein
MIVISYLMHRCVSHDGGLCTFCHLTLCARCPYKEPLESAKGLCPCVGKKKRDLTEYVLPIPIIMGFMKG